MTESFIETVVGEAFDGMPPTLIAAAALHDPVVQTMIMTLRGGLRPESSISGLLLDHAGTMLALQLFGSYGSASLPSRSATKGGLGASRQRRVIDYIENHLGEDLNLAALAQEAGLSPHHFAKVFKKSVGKSPWQYVSDRRILRAKRMLRDGGQSLAEIAHELGFSSQSHFTDAFRKATGSPPSDFRRNYR
jgi:AraC family transcriptional regulator